MEGRGQRPGDVVMTTHWRIPATGFVESCGFDFSVPNAWADFHDYGVLWEQDRLVHFVDRKPAFDIEVSAGFEDPMYMIVNLAMGAKSFEGVGFGDESEAGSRCSSSRVGILRNLRVLVQLEWRRRPRDRRRARLHPGHDTPAAASCKTTVFAGLAHHRILLSVELHERAIFSDRIFNGHGHFPIVSHSQGSQNRYCTKPLAR